MKKYVCVIASLDLKTNGAGFDGTPAGAIPAETIETLNLPPNLQVQRVTFQTTVDTNGNLGAVLINTRPPNNSRDGVLIVGQTDTTSGFILPSRFTFEAFQGGEITNTFYLAAVYGTIVGFCDVQIIFEGYER